jgi:hypothetical protein
MKRCPTYKTFFFITDTKDKGARVFVLGSLFILVYYLRVRLWMVFTKLLMIGDHDIVSGLLITEKISLA